MDRNYWQEYWDNYYKFMAVYLGEVQNAYPDVDIKREYVEVANLFEPPIPLEDYENMDGGGNINSGQDNNQSSMPGTGMSGNQSSMPGTGMGGNQSTTSFTEFGEGQSAAPFGAPGGGQFTINNCRRMAIVRIELIRGLNPSNFFMVVDRADRRSIQGFRIACDGGRVRFVPMAVEYRNINLIECAF